MKRDELREAQRPLKERYRDDPETARLTLRADGGLGSETVACSVETGRVLAEGDLDFRGTLGVDREARVGFTAIRLRFELDSEASDEELDALLETTERYCVVYQTLLGGVPVEVSRA